MQYILNKLIKSDGKYQYMVYISSLGLITYITLIEDLANYSKHLFSLYVFMNEENDKKKVKLHSERFRHCLKRERVRNEILLFTHSLDDRSF